MPELSGDRAKITAAHRARAAFVCVRQSAPQQVRRNRDKVTKIIDEIASDASLFLKEGSDYVGLIGFVWDDSRRTEEHALLREGLRQIRGVVGSVVVPRPGRMQ